MSELRLPWVEISVLLPFFGAIWVAFLGNGARARIHSIVICTITLLFAVGEWIDFATLDTFEAHDHWDIFQILFHRDIFVIDELSAPLLPLGALLYLTTVLTTLRTKVGRFSFSSTLLSESILLATLACRGPWMIILLLTISVIPPYLELKKRAQNTRVFTLHMGLSIALLVIGQLLMPEGASSANPPLLAGCCLTAGALLRSGICPLHCWMTDLFEKATFGTALLFVTPMTGAYAIMRLVFPIAPAWALQSIAILSLITAVYAAGMALVQRNSRRFFCYLFLSHSSLVLVGLEMGTPIGLAGALCVWLSVGISLLGFGLALRCVEARTGRLALENYHGLFDHIPFLASMFLLTGLSSIGFPGTVGFIGTELLIEGAVDIYPIVGLTVVIATALNGIAVLKAYFHVFTGRHRPASISMGVRNSERITILIIVLLILGGGIVPQPGVHSRYHAARSLIELRDASQLGRDSHSSNTTSPSHSDHSDKQSEHSHD